MLRPIPSSLHLRLKERQVTDANEEQKKRKRNFEEFAT
jgi:hypothetical protein